MEWYTRALRQYSNFRTRARRKEFWVFQFVHLLILTAFGVLETIFGLIEKEIGFLSTLYFIFMIIPWLACAVRRLHDTNKNGAWITLLLVPIVGWIILLIFLTSDSDRGENKYGKSPKYFIPESTNTVEPF